MQLPSVFYKYTSPNTALKILENGRLRWSSPLLFNDIAEFRRMPRFDPTVADAHHLLPEAIAGVVFDGTAIDEERLAPAMKALLYGLRAQAAAGLKREGFIARWRHDAPDADEKIEIGLRSYIEAWDLSRARVLCVTTEYNNQVMWGNYAESHAGCVLGFRHIEERSTPFLGAQPVAYSEDRPVVGSGLDFLLYGDTSELRERTVRAICYTKTSDWSYEREWRALTWRPNEHGRRYDDFLFYPEELESITLGVRASQTTEAKLREIVSVKYPHAIFYRMRDMHGEMVRCEIPREGSLAVPPSSEI